jgi:hypothetical protein
MNVYILARCAVVRVAQEVEREMNFGYVFDASQPDPHRNHPFARRGALLIVVLFFGIVAWILLSGRSTTTIIIAASAGTLFSVDGDVARPRLRPGSSAPGALETHYLRLEPGEHEITVTEPTGDVHAHVLQVAKRDRPLVLLVHNRQLKVTGAAETQ